MADESLPVNASDITISDTNKNSKRHHSSPCYSNFFHLTTSYFDVRTFYKDKAFLFQQTSLVFSSYCSAMYQQLSFSYIVHTLWKRAMFGKKQQKAHLAEPNA